MVGLPLKGKHTLHKRLVNSSMNKLIILLIIVFLCIIFLVYVNPSRSDSIGEFLNAIFCLKYKRNSPYSEIGVYNQAHINRNPKFAYFQEEQREFIFVDRKTFPHIENESRECSPSISNVFRSSKPEKEQKPAPKPITSRPKGVVPSDFSKEITKGFKYVPKKK